MSRGDGTRLAQVCQRRLPQRPPIEASWRSFTCAADRSAEIEEVSWTSGPSPQPLSANRHNRATLDGNGLQTREP